MNEAVSKSTVRPRHRELASVTCLARTTILGLTMAAVLMTGRAAVAVSPAPSPSGGPRAAPAVGHVFVIIMENHGYGDIIGNAAAPVLPNQAAATYGVAGRYYAVAHPSQPNYIALTSGGTQGVVNDGRVTLDVPNLADQVEDAGRTWTAYMQSLATCDGDVVRSFCGGQLYARKHDPFVSDRRHRIGPGEVVAYRGPVPARQRPWWRSRRRPGCDYARPMP